MAEKHAFGFSLVELLVAIAIVGIVSTVSVQMLYDGVTMRSKQYSLEESNENARIFLRRITKEIIESESVDVLGSGTINIIFDEGCTTYSFDSANKSILYKNTADPSCASVGTVPVFGPSVEISDLAFSPEGESLSVVNIKLTGTYKDSLGEHEINYETSVTPRATIEQTEEEEET